MKRADQHRRQLMKGMLGAVALQSFPHLSFAQTDLRIRPEWQQFKETIQYQSFLNAIASMRRNTNPADPGSLHYWVNVHQTYCPHDVPYFIAWHRGYLYYFEQQLRIASGDPTLALPYWDYYSYPTLPAEFTDPAPSNPLYLERAGTNVYNALTLWPFAPEVYNFQRGTTDAFEFRMENAPHNPVHNLIGGVMATMQSPFDPIFYLHHANIDRLTHAWALPDGKGIPFTDWPYSPTNSHPYWAGSHVYAPDLTIERWRTYHPRWLGYEYADTTVPTSLPSPEARAQVARVGQPSSPHLPSNGRPPFRRLTPALASQILTSRRPLSGAAQIVVDEHSHSTSLRFTKIRYDYADTTVPTSPPSAEARAQVTRGGQPLAPRLPSNERPPFKRFTPTPARQISANRRSVGGAAQIVFDEQSYSASLSFNQKDAAEIAAIIASRRAGQNGPGGGRVGSVKFVVDTARLSDLGRQGGYFYALYLNMPAVVDSKTAYNTSFLGTLGAFQIAAVSHHGPGRLEFDLVGLLLKQEVKDFSTLSISWIRVDGDNPPAGQTINVAEARVDLSYEIEPVQPPRPKGLRGYK
jgi:tyrosinase